MPANTQEVRSEARSIAGSEFDFIQYESNLNPDQVRNFYRRTLSAAGWKENNYLDALKQLPDFKVDTAAIRAMEQNLNFEKDGLTLSITFAPETAARKTGYTVMQGRLDLAGKDAGEMDFIPRLLTKPQKEPAPVYPEAALITLSEGDNFLQAAYTVKDDVDTVADFYIRNMPVYGWYLVEDRPIKNIDTTVRPEDIAKYCPECAKTGVAIPQTYMAMKELIFSNSSKDKCSIGLFQVDVPAQAQASGMSFTNIMVDYEKK